MMRITLKFCALLALSLLFGCGQQGPLYFQEDTPAQNNQEIDKEQTLSSDEEQVKE